MTCFRKVMLSTIAVIMIGSAFGLENVDVTWLKPTPDAVAKGSIQPVQFTWPTTLAETDKGLSDPGIKVFIGSKQATIVSKPDKKSVTVTLPPIDVTGVIDVRVTDAKDQAIATSTIRYMSGPDIVARAKTGTHLWMTLFYVVLLVFFPLALMWTDILKAYAFASESRQRVMDKMSPDKMTLEELKILVAEIDTSPPGIPGLARATFAFTLLLLIGLVIFHFLVVSKTDIPPAVEKLLTILGTALTSIIAFYFGTKAAEGSTGAPTTGAPGPKPPASTVTPVPSSGKTNETITLQGVGFGTETGIVLFGDEAATVQSWKDTELRVTVPKGIGQVTITVKPKGKDPIVSAPNAFTIN
jgi:hypothetical protein